MSDEEIDIEEMRCALIAIASEMKKFNNDILAPNESYNSDNLINELLKYKNMLNLRREQIKLLRRNLKTACIVAKALSTAKANETESLNSQLINVRTQYLDLAKQEKDKNNLISILRAENQTLRDKIQCYDNFIALGYKDLLKQNKENLESHMTNLGRLQKIILCCGQFHTNYQNQVTKCTQLKQKIRFLNSKLRIVESNVDLVSERFKNSRVTKDIKLQAKKENRSESQLSSNLGVQCSDCQMEHYESVTNLKTIKTELDKHSLLENFAGLDLTDHFVTVKKLLNDQDTLIKDLKCLSYEINIETFQH